MGQRVYETPGGIPFTGFYWPEIMRELLSDLRARRERLGLTDENEFEVHVQMLRAFGVVGHLNNTRADTIATELLLDSAGLLESVKQILRAVGIELSGATPAAVDVVMKLSEITTVDKVGFIPDLSSFSTDSVPPIGYEADEMDLDRSDRVAHVYGLEQTASGTGSVVSTSPNVFTRDSGAWAADVVNQHLFLSESDRDNGGEYRVVERLNDDDVRVVTVPGSGEPGFLTETTITWSLKEFSIDYATKANTDSDTFQVWSGAPSLLDCIYVSHGQVMPARVDLVHSSPATSNIVGVWEYFDNERTQLYPTSVTDNGSTLTFDLTTLLGSERATGAQVTVQLAATGAKEVVTSVWDGGLNKITTDGLLGQVTPSTDPTDYLVTADWVPYSNLEDDTSAGTGSFSQDGAATWDLPQTRERGWLSTEVNLEEGFWFRFRHTYAPAGATNPTFDRIKINGGDQYVMRTCGQGETIGPQILGSSSGGLSQRFRLAEYPYIDGSETVEVDEAGTGTWLEYRYVESILYSASTSRVYTRQVDAESRCVVVFGDGEHGKVPPAGSDNVRATYRTFGLAGDTEDGNVGIDQVTVNSDGVGGLAEVFNPRPAYGWRMKEGGSEADLERVKRDRPAALRIRKTAARPEDAAWLAINEFVDSAGTKPVARAFAEEEKYGVKTIGLLVVGAGGTVLTRSQLDELDEYYNGDRYARPPVDGVLMSNYRVTSSNYEPRLVAVEATVTWAGGSAERIRNALLLAITPLAVEVDGVTYVFDFGGHVSHSRIAAAIHAVDPGVTDVPTLKLNAVEDSYQLGTNELPYTNAASISLSVQS